MLRVFCHLSLYFMRDFVKCWADCSLDCRTRVNLLLGQTAYSTANSSRSFCSYRCLCAYKEMFGFTCFFYLSWSSHFTRGLKLSRALLKFLKCLAPLPSDYRPHLSNMMIRLPVNAFKIKSALTKSMNAAFSLIEQNEACNVQQLPVTVCKHNVSSLAQHQCWNRFL